MKQWIKKVLGITSLESRLKFQEDKWENNRRIAINSDTKANRLTEEFAKLHSIDADIHYKDMDYIIFSGKLKGREYVKIYRVPKEKFKDLNDYLKNTVRETRIDAPIGFHI